MIRRERDTLGVRTEKEKIRRGMSHMKREWGECAWRG